MILLAFAAGVMVAITLVQLYMLGPRANDFQRRIDELEAALKERETVPYSLRNGLEDVLAPNTNMRVMLQNLRVLQENIQAFADRAELDLEAQSDLIGQIRSGQYRKEQPARNGRVRERS